MKYLFALLLASSAYALDLNSVKFVMDQKVTYPVPKFYSRVCTGNAIIYSVWISKKNIWYTIKTSDLNRTCPVFFDVLENQLLAVKE